MQLEVNGEPREVAAGTTVRELLVTLSLDRELVAVERNETIVPRAEHTTAVLCEGDRVEIVRFVGGG